MVAMLASDHNYMYKFWLTNHKELSYERGMCIKGLKWPPLEQKTEICFSQISLNSFIRRMAKV